VTTEDLPDDATVREYVSVLLKHFAAKLNGWEERFVKNLAVQENTFTDKQRSGIDRLMARMAKNYRGPERSDDEDD
jgi:hypothetical protein